MSAKRVAPGVSTLRWRGRLPLIAVIALALGIATDFGIAVLCQSAGVRGASSVAGGTGTLGEGWSTRVWRGRCRDVCNITMTRNQPASRGPTPDDIHRELPHAAWRSAYDRAVGDARIKSAFINGQAYGWPMRSWAGYFINSPEAGLIDSWFTLRIGGWSRQVPPNPIFPGALVNSAAYAAAWFALVLGTRAVWKLRRKPGFCRECGYSLRGLRGNVCPECGATAESRKEQVGK